MRQISHGPEETNCPFYQKPQSEVCHKCALWTLVRGKDPQSNEEFNEWRCSLAWLPVMIIEAAQQSRQTGAAVESFRNEMVRQNLMIMENQQKRIGTADE